MLKQLMNGSSWLALRDGTNDDGVVDPKIALREQIAKGNLPNKDEPVVTDPPDIDPDTDDDDDNIDPDAVIKDPPEETEAQKKEREAAEKVVAKAKRKNDRMQARIDEATAAAKAAKAELEAFKIANPDVKLTEEEVQSRAQKIADDKLAAKRAADTQKSFDDACAKLAKDATKIDKDFDDKVNDMADQFGPIPSFMIGVLEDFDNGAEVLAHIVNDEDVAEKIYNLKVSPAKMTKELVAISNKLIEAKKKPRREISKVPDPVEPVNGSRHVSTVITEADTKNMDSYVAKRRLQMEAAKKARGW